MSAEIKGLDKVLDGLDNAIGVEKIEKNMQKACAIVERAAKEKAIKGRGDLRRSITSKVETEGETVIGKVYTPLEYAPYVEYGTGLYAEGGNGRQDVPWSYQDIEGEWHTTCGREPTPFLRPALEENRFKVIEKLREGLLDNG